MLLQGPRETCDRGLDAGGRAQLQEALGNAGGLLRCHTLPHQLQVGLTFEALLGVAGKASQDLSGGLRPSRLGEVLAFRCRLQLQASELELAPALECSARSGGRGGRALATAHREILHPVQLLIGIVAITHTAEEKEAELRGTPDVNEVCIRVKGLAPCVLQGREAVHKVLVAGLLIAGGLDLDPLQSITIHTDTHLLEISEALSKITDVELEEIPHGLARLELH
mmetsp:Transcript_8475/g.18693  ORF Transcript_8475/g.18693 Transcript_8475/m.18693 type:complete len:225 (+) Transcript_8475:601-1275(+)